MQIKSYKTPQVHIKTFKQENERPLNIGLCIKVQLSEWSSPTFCILKKDRRIQIIIDSRKVNKTI